MSNQAFKAAEHVTNSVIESIYLPVNGYSDLAARQLTSHLLQITPVAVPEYLLCGQELLPQRQRYGALTISFQLCLRHSLYIPCKTTLSS